MSSIEPTAQMISGFQQGLIILGAVILTGLFFYLLIRFRLAFWGGQEVEKL